MPRNLYADINMFEERFTQDTALTASDRASVILALESVSRLIDAYTNRHFWLNEAQTRYYDGNGSDHLTIHDLVAATSIKVDDDGDRTFEETLAAATDYFLLREGHDDQYGAIPKTLLVIDAINFKTRLRFQRQRRLVEIVGDWGFTNTTEDTGATVSTDPGVSGTSLTVSDGTKFAAGQTLRIQNEQVYVVSVAANVLTIDRGVNGTTGAAHAIATAIRRYVYTPEVREAAIIQVGRLWKRREAAYAGAFTSIPLSGPFQFTKELDADLEALLQPMWRPPVW